MTLETWIARTPDAAADARALEAWLRAAPDGACILDDDGRRWWCWRVGAARAVRWFERPGEFGQTPESLVRSAGAFEPAPERSAPPARPRGPAPTRPTPARRRAPGRGDRSPRGQQRRRGFGVVVHGGPGEEPRAETATAEARRACSAS